MKTAMTSEKLEKLNKLLHKIDDIIKSDDMQRILNTDVVVDGDISIANEFKRLTAEVKALVKDASAIEEVPELLPCPFCGSEAKLLSHCTIPEHGADTAGDWAVVCQNQDADCNVRLLYCHSKEEAITQWNRRVTNN